MTNKFQFYEGVIIASDELKHQKINRKEGVIIGMVQSESGDWLYAVEVDSDGWTIHEKHLKSNGKVYNREDFYDELGKIKLIVDKDGKGEIKQYFPLYSFAP